MKHLKDLVVEVRRALEATPTAETPGLEKALDAAVEFLSSTKSFEYSGELTCSGSLVKLVDAKVDFDDVIKLLAGKQSDIKLLAEIYVVTHADPPAEETKAAA